MTAIGVFEDMALASSSEELKKLAGGRSVYSESEIAEWAASKDRPVKVINYLLAGYFEPPVGLECLTKLAIFAGHPPQSIAKLDENRAKAILNRLNLGFKIS